MNDTIVYIKDDFATYESAKSIIKHICMPLIDAMTDINLKQIVIAINDTVEDGAYVEYFATGGIPTNVTINTIMPKSKLDFANFHNFVAEAIAQCEYKDINLHIVSGALLINTHDVEIKAGCKTQVGSFISDLLELMTLLKRPIWFSTASDMANYAYNHYYTSADIINVDGKVKHFTAPQCIMWSGNSNLDWIYVNTAIPVYVNTAIPVKPPITFETCYEYDFLAIKDLIAKYTVVPGYYVNLFPTIPREVGTFFRVPMFNRDNIQYDFTGDKYKNNIDLFSKNNANESCQPKTVNDVIAYMQKVLPKK